NEPIAIPRGSVVLVASLLQRGVVDPEVADAVAAAMIRRHGDVLGVPRSGFVGHLKPESIEQFANEVRQGAKVGTSPQAAIGVMVDAGRTDLLPEVRAIVAEADRQGLKAATLREYARMLEWQTEPMTLLDVARNTGQN